MHASRTRRDGGFTLIELVIAIGILVISTAIGVRSVDGLMGSRAVVGAQATFSSFAARARLHAVQTGKETQFIANANKDVLEIQQDGVVIQSFGLKSDLGVDLVMDRDGVRICYDARGIAIPPCNSFSAPLVATMVRGTHQAQLRIHTFGQITRKSE